MTAMPTIAMRDAKPTQRLGEANLSSILNTLTLIRNAVLSVDLTFKCNARLSLPVGRQ
jgi:hypothetical protein